MTGLLNTLATELEGPREVTAQVMDHVTGTYGINRDAIGAFLENALAGLEEYEIDLILSPLFTPTLRDQSVLAGLLGRDSVPREQWPSLVAQLAARPTRARLVTDDGAVHTVPLREVSIERFVFRLRLDGTIADDVFKFLTDEIPTAQRPLLMAVARRAVWSDAPRVEILGRALMATGHAGSNSDDMVALLKLMETYEPANAADLLAQIPHWQRVLRQEINDAAGPKPFFNERVQDLHGGGRDQRRADDSRVSSKEDELAFLGRLQAVLSPGGQ